MHSYVYTYLTTIFSLSFTHRGLVSNHFVYEKFEKANSKARVQRQNVHQQTTGVPFILSTIVPRSRKYRSTSSTYIKSLDFVEAVHELRKLILRL